MGNRAFHFVCELASGGMGRVDLVVRREGRFRRLYAAKRLHAHHREDPDVLAMFLDEARLAGWIRHPNVVSVLDVVRDETEPYLLMEYVEGVSVSRLLAQGPLPLAVAVQIGIEVADALHAAHELRDEEGRSLGLVHRDVSPQNILVGFDGRVRLTDFGIAKALDRGSRTSTGVLKGKLGYLSPEQLRFEPLDRRADLFSLGVVLHEMVTGRRLYANQDGRGPSRILHEPPPDVGADRADLPPGIVELVFELLAKDPEDRPPDARSVAERLRALLEEVAALTGPVDLAGHVNAACHAERETERTRLSAAMRALEAGELRPWPPRADEEPTLAAAPRRRLLRMLVVGAGLVVALGVGAVLGQLVDLGEDGQNAESEGGGDAARTSARTTTAADPAPAAEDVGEAEPSATGVAGDPGAADNASSETEADEPSRRDETPAAVGEPAPRRAPRSRARPREAPAALPPAEPPPAPPAGMEGPLWRIR